MWWNLAEKYMSYYIQHNRDHRFSTAIRGFLARLLPPSSAPPTLSRREENTKWFAALLSNRLPAITPRRTNRQFLHVSELLRFIWEANLDSFSRHTLKERETAACSTKVNGYVSSGRVALGEGFVIPSEAAFPTAFFWVLCPTPLEKVECYSWPLRYPISPRECRHHGYPRLRLNWFGQSV